MFMGGGGSLNEGQINKTVPQSLELFKMDFSLYLRPIYQLCYQLKSSIKSLSSVISYSDCPLFAQSHLALSQRDIEKLLPQVSLYNSGRVPKIITKSTTLKTKLNPKTFQSKSQLTYNKSLKYFKCFKNIFP